MNTATPSLRATPSKEGERIPKAENSPSLEGVARSDGVAAPNTSLKLKQLYCRFNMPTEKLMGASVLASFGAPVAFAVFLSVLFILSFKNFTFQKIIEENSLGLIATSLGLAWLVSLFLTLTLTFLIYLLANLFGKKIINVGFVSVVYVAGFIMVAISRMDFRDVPDLGVPSFLIGFAAANALTFSFLAFRWSEKNDLL